jgi:signal transduction histidine kinase
MTSPQAPEPGPKGEPVVPFPRLAGFVRQVIHDVRNGLNSMDLQAAYIVELSTEAEVTDEVRRLRALIQTSAKQLQALSFNFWSGAPSRIEYAANILIEDFQDRLQKQYPEHAPKVQWAVELKEEAVSVDIEMFFGALTRIFENAFLFAEAGGEIKVRVFTEAGQFVLELAETKKSAAPEPEHWGEEPFVSTRRGGYGLGLFRARRLLALHGAELKIVHDSGRALLISRVSLPVVSPA